MSPTPRDAREQALLDAVYEHLADDAPRLAYAAHLKGLGDPFGELVELSIACEKKPSKKAEARVAELIAAHGPAFLGPLAPFVPAASARFRRGLLARCELVAPPAASAAERLARVEQIAGDVRWTTLERLTLRSEWPDVEFSPARALLSSPRLASLRSLGSVSTADLSWLASGPPRALETLRADLRRAPTRAEARALSLAEGLPSLKKLWLFCLDHIEPGDLDAFAWLHQGKLLDRLEALCLSRYGALHIPARLPHLRRSRSLERLLCWSAWVTRDGAGELARLEIEIEGPMPQHIQMMLDAMPKGLVSEIRVHGHKGLARRPDTVKKLADHAARLGARFAQVPFKKRPMLEG